MSTTTTTTIMKRPITKYLVGSAAGLLLLGVAALSGLTGGAQAGTQPTAGVLVRAGMPQVDTRVDTRLTLVTNSRVTYSEPTGGQTTYQVSYGDGASGDLF